MYNFNLCLAVLKSIIIWLFLSRIGFISNKKEFKKNDFTSFLTFKIQVGASKQNENVIILAWHSYKEPSLHGWKTLTKINFKNYINCYFCFYLTDTLEMRFCNVPHFTTNRSMLMKKSLSNCKAWCNLFLWKNKIFSINFPE